MLCPSPAACLAARKRHHACQQLAAKVMRNAKLRDLRSLPVHRQL